MNLFGCSFSPSCKNSPAMSENLACVYAALMLHDAGMQVTTESLTKATAAAGVKVRPTLPVLITRFLEKRSMTDLISSAAAAGASTKIDEEDDAPGAGPAAAAAPAAGKAAKKEEPEEEEDDFGMGGLF